MSDFGTELTFAVLDFLDDVIFVRPDADGSDLVLSSLPYVMCDCRVVHCIISSSASASESDDSRNGEVSLRVCFRLFFFRPFFFLRFCFDGCVCCSISSSSSSSSYNGRNRVGLSPFSSCGAVICNARVCSSVSAILFSHLIHIPISLLLG